MRPRRTSWPQPSTSTRCGPQHRLRGGNTACTLAAIPGRLTLARPACRPDLRRDFPHLRRDLPHQRRDFPHLRRTCHICAGPRLATSARGFVQAILAKEVKNLRAELRHCRLDSTSITPFPPERARSHLSPFRLPRTMRMMSAIAVSDCSHGNACGPRHDGASKSFAPTPVPTYRPSRSPLAAASSS